ncbi:MAG: hypothetical protein M3N22_07785, partial [Acidobacteriota bacterium]|nr:hypothetical protein [Acidobacteriota bacterium]
SQAGLFFAMQFGGSLIGVAISSVVQARRGYRAALVLGYLLEAAGIVGLNASSEYSALFVTAVYGCGFGVAIPATNLCIAEISGPRRSASLNLLNMAWGGGAIVCPLLILAGLKFHLLSEILIMLTACAVLLSFVFWFTKFETHNTKLPGASAAMESGRRHPLHVPVALGMLFFIYVGTENGISGWAAEEARRVGAAGSATIIPMFFWAALLSGRGLSALILSRIKENSLVISGLLVSVLGTACLALAISRTQIIGSVILAGVGLSGVYPIFISWLSKWYGEQARRLGGVMFSLASLGGATVPWVVGFVSQRSNSLRSGLLVPLVGCIAMMAVVSALRRRISA